MNSRNFKRRLAKSLTHSYNEINLAFANCIRLHLSKVDLIVILLFEPK